MWTALIPLASTALGAIGGASQAKAQREANAAQLEAAAAQTEFSPWTGMGAGSAAIQAPTTSAFQGGLGGFMFGQQNAQGISDMFKGFGGSSSKPNVYSGGSPLGGKQMSADLGNRYGVPLQEEPMKPQYNLGGSWSLLAKR